MAKYYTKKQMHADYEKVSSVIDYYQFEQLITAIKKANKKGKGLKRSETRANTAFQYNVRGVAIRIQKSPNAYNEYLQSVGEKLQPSYATTTLHKLDTELYRNLEDNGVSGETIAELRGLSPAELQRFFEENPDLKPLYWYHQVENLSQYMSFMGGDLDDTLSSRLK